MRFFAALNSPGGHIAVALFIFLVGVALAIWGHKDVGAPAIVSGATSSIYTMLNTGKKDTKPDDRDSSN